MCGVLGAKSRTTTLPRMTVVVVPEQVSFVSHFVPRDVAEDDLPTVRKLPCESPQRCRLRLRLALALAFLPLPLLLQGPTGPVRYASVTGRFVPRWRVLNLPP